MQINEEASNEILMRMSNRNRPVNSSQSHPKPHPILKPSVLVLDLDFGLGSITGDSSGEMGVEAVAKIGAKAGEGEEGM